MAYNVDLDRATIAAFGSQWQHYREIDGYFGSLRLLEDILTPLVPLAELQGRYVAEIGSGSGRIVSMLIRAGACRVVALEPSAAFSVLQQNTREYAGRVTCLPLSGEQLPPSGDLDYVFSIGVLHHITDPLPVLRAAYAAMKPGGNSLPGFTGKRATNCTWP